MANWYYKYDNIGKKQGPIDVAQLKMLALQGTITPETIIENRHGQTRKVNEVNGLCPTPSLTVINLIHCRRVRQRDLSAKGRPPDDCQKYLHIFYEYFDKILSLVKVIFTNLSTIFPKTLKKGQTAIDSFLTCS